MKIQGLQHIDKTVSVFVSGLQLYPDYSQKIDTISPTGFQWGYRGAGPSQLALALLLLFTDKDSALVMYKDLVKEFIASLPKDQNFDKEFDIPAWIKDHGYKLSKHNLRKGFKISEEEMKHFKLVK